MRLLATLLCTAALLPAASPGPTPAQIRTASARALARLQQSQKSWYTNETCSSCHHQFLPALAYQAAREHSIPFDEKIARADAARAFHSLTDFDSILEQTHNFDPGIGGSLTLVAAHAAGVQPTLATAAYARFLLLRQRPAGNWVSFDERPPQSYSLFSATALSLRAIDLYSHPNLRPQAQAAIAKASHWLASNTPRNTEDRTFQLLGLKWSGAAPATLAPLAQALLQTQQPDGGWNSLEGRPSDAYSTGQALVALDEAGVTAHLDASRGIDYLLKTQARDGTWHVPTRLHPPAPLSPDYFESNYPYAHDQFLSALGASWAVMAFARALGPARQAAPAPLREDPPALEPWVETVLFGTAADLKHLLDTGLDPNAATRSGGMTPLMLAAPGVEKMTLLLDRGANINTQRPTSGYTALLTTALYADSAAAIKLLLARGVQPPKDPVYSNATPLALAALAGNAESVKLLHAAGESANEIFDYAGLSSAAPLLLMIPTNDLAVAQSLLDAGAEVDRPDPEGLTPLHWAVLGNHVELAQLLLNHGAQVNRQDKHGMTPLLYAANIDFGDHQMLDRLLKSGANPAARTPENQSARDLATQHHHTHLLPALPQQ
ncbi:MAG TPA: ankyrin repeat domain-containing protein [Bryobacteraceae bacterium]|jgi:N-acyl-D-amino-acid deacylase